MDGKLFCHFSKEKCGIKFSIILNSYIPSEKSYVQTDKKSLNCRLDISKRFWLRLFSKIVSLFSFEILKIIFYQLTSSEFSGVSKTLKTGFFIVDEIVIASSLNWTPFSLSKVINVGKSSRNSSATVRSWGQCNLLL